MTLVHQAGSISYLVVSTLPTPCTAALQAPLSMGFPRQEYWSGLPFPSPGDLPNPETELRSPALQADSLLCPYGVIHFIDSNGQEEKGTTEDEMAGWHH